jgi:hypothetical protein
MGILSKCFLMVALALDVVRFNLTGDTGVLDVFPAFIFMAELSSILFNKVT